METVSLVLGTAQLGLSYGIANKTGQPNLDQAQAIVQEAWNHGVREFDTAQGYGISETVLGKTLKKLGTAQDAKVVSKFDPALNHQDKDQLSSSLEQTLEQLAVPQLYGMMLHREALLELWEEIQKQKPEMQHTALNMNTETHKKLKQPNL